MNLDDFNNLDPQNIGNWPIVIKAVLICVLCAATLFAGYWFDTQHQILELLATQTKEEMLKKDFKEKQQSAATLPKLTEQLEQIEYILKELFKKLPSDSQVDELIRDISQTMIASGLKQELFQPQYKSERKEKGLYIKLPIKLRAKGDYHAFGKFVSGIAAMNRIVTQHDVSIKAAAGGLLIINMKTQIYRYIDNKNQQKKRKK